MGRKSRKRYSAEFKLEAVRLASEGDRPPTAVARELGINPSLIHRWIAAFEESGARAFGNRRKAESTKGESASEAEIRRLRRELEDIRKDRDILKKALAYFAKHQD